MILDAFALLSDAQAFTATGASTSTIDGGDPSVGATIDDYAGCWYRAVVTTAFAGATTTTGTVTFALQSDSTTAFTAAVTHISSAALAQSTAVAGYVLQSRIPVGVKRYIRAYITCSTTVATGTVDQYIVKDPDINSLMILKG